MASFLSTLPKNLRMGFSFIVHGVREKLSANRIIETLRRTGLGARRQTVLDVIRGVKEDLAAFDDVSKITPRILPTLSRIPDARHTIFRNFSYSFRIDEILSGKLTSRFVTLSTNSFMGFPEAKEAMVSALENAEFTSSGVTDELAGDDYRVESISLIDVRKQPGML